MEATLRRRPGGEIPADEAIALDRFIGRALRSATTRRLCLGELLAWLHMFGGAEELGFPDTASYGAEIIQQSRRWCEDSRRLAKKLSILPLIREALQTGQITWSMAELIARAATPETEAVALEDAKTKTLRAMRAALHKPADPDDEPERSTIGNTLDRTDAWFVEATRKQVAAVADSGSSVEFVEALLAEGMTRMIADIPNLELPDMARLTPGARQGGQPGVAPKALGAQFEARLAKARAQMSVSAAEREAELDRKRERHNDECSALIDERIPMNALHVHELITDRVTALGRFELQLSQAIHTLVIAGPWKDLGYDSLEHYARERLGMSLSTVRSRCHLAVCVVRMPSLYEALQAGRIGLEAARMIGRHSESDTIDAWIARAERRTVKHLREEIEAASLLSRVTGDATLAAPPDDEALETVFELERAVLSGAVGHAQMSEQMSGSEEDDVEVRPEPRVPVNLPMREDQARMWRALELVYRKHATGRVPFVVLLCRCVWESWRDHAKHMA